MLRRILFPLLALFLASTLSFGAARAEEMDEEIPPHAGANWAWGARFGAPLHVGTVGSRQYSIAPALPGVPDTLSFGVSASAYLERTLNDYARLGLEAAWEDSTLAELETERDFITLLYGPYLRLVLLPGRISPYAVASAQLYHAWAKGLPGTHAITGAPLYALQELRTKADFTYSVGGGFEFPITPDYAATVEGRLRHYLQGGADPKEVVLVMGFHIWLK